MKRILSVFVCLMIGLFCYGQVPQAFSYQALAIGDDGSVLTNQDIDVKININTGNATGITAYTETHNLTTSNAGIFSVEVGNGVPLNGLFTDIDWSTGAYFLSVEVDETGTGFYQNIGVSQLLSVPYALYAEGGVPGAAGAAGPPGAYGTQGAQGPQGPKGATGAAGAQGPAGPCGPTGPQGGQGGVGPVGLNGANGGGTNCWDSNNNLVNDLEEDLNGDGVFSAHDCLGPQGLQGAKGPTGPVGNPSNTVGPVGSTGAKGDKGDVGPVGPKGPTIECSPWVEQEENLSFFGSVGIGTTNPTCALDVSGTIAAYGVTLSSDIRYKQNIVQLEGMLNKIVSLEGVQYLFREKGFEERGFSKKLQIGLIAQEVEKVFPELVITKMDGYKAVNYSKFSPVLLEALRILYLEKEASQTALNKKYQQLEEEADRLEVLFSKTQ